MRVRVKKLRLAFILAGLSLLAFVSTAFGMLMAVAGDVPELASARAFDPSANSVLEDVHGERLSVLTSNEGRIILRADEIGLAAQHAVIAVEDQRFFEHEGVDPRGMARALVQDLMQGRAAQGGSTIAQQFVKNATKAQDERTVTQKLREAALAFHLNRKWPKQRILTEYLNSIYYGNGAYGIESAARTYFGDDVNHRGCGPPRRRCAAELKPHEGALLAAVIASPGAYDPVARPAAARARRDLVLRKMQAQGYLTGPELARALAEPLPPRSQVNPPVPRAITPATAYFATWVRQQLADRYGARRAFEGGLEVRTTLDLGLQRAAERAVGSWLGDLGPAAAVVALDNDTGEVRAMVGGSDYRRRPFNLATQGQRQPGSAFKPFVLATALKEGISPGSLWYSGRKSFPLPSSRGRDRFVPRNYEDTYLGPTTLARATATSDNSVYAELGIKVGVGDVARTARRLGIRTPVSRNYAMTLGGLKEGVTTLDMAHAYQTLAAGGRRITGTMGTGKDGPVAIRAVRRGDRREENRPLRERVLDEDVAEATTGVLASVIESGTATRADLGPVPAWGKTGTTENYGDAWFVGATDELTVAVWVGYPDRMRPMETEWRGQPVAGGTFPAAIWRSFMLDALRLACDSEREQETERCEAAGLGPAPEPPAPGAPP
ncbi:MAG: transglycosylase domain-containing protein, partial [Actinomycetota bacterium]|nr:transglycosylase domain-containing protein [Actinomycetota bacterium]